MRENIRKYYNILQQDKKRRKKWYIVVACMAVLVAGATSYALMKPAITMEKTGLCTTEHEHDESCNVPNSDAKQGGGAQKSLRYENDDYSVEVKFTADAKIPDSAELKAEEIKKDTDQWKELYQQASDKMKLETPASFCRFVDISFIDNGKEIEPAASVDVQVSYKNEDIKNLKKSESSVVHFADDGIEVIPATAKKTSDGSAEFSFTQDSFSIVGVVVTGEFDLRNGSYIFYDQRNDGKEIYALGADNYGDVRAVPITVDSNGYVSMKEGWGDVSVISWTYDGSSLRNGYTKRYLQLGTENYASANSISTSYNKVPITGSTISNLTFFYRTASASSYGSHDYFLGFDEDTASFYSTKADGHEYRDYLITAKVGTPEELGIRDTDLSISDTIVSDGCLKPVLKNHQASSYTWYRSKDKQNWEQVDRKKVTGDRYNMSENGEWLNVSLDGGARYYYKVEASYVDGTQLTTPISSNPYRVPYYDSLQNGSFEKPEVPASSRADDYQPFMPNNTDGMVWRTTAQDSEIEYISVAYQNFKEYSIKWHYAESAAKGNQYVELNAKAAGALYQDVLTIPDSTMYWKLSHRGRGIKGYRSGETDTMYVVIMSTDLAEKNEITTQAKVEDVVRNPSKYPGASVRKITSDNLSWHYYTDAYKVPEGQYMSRYFFVAGSTAFDRSGDTSAAPFTVGNHLDDVSFSTDIPAPTPGKANLVINKEIKGLSEEQARAVLAKLTFTVGNETIRGSDFSNFKKTGDNTFTASYVSREIATLGNRTITENTDSAAYDGYECKTTASAGSQQASETNKVTVTLKEDTTSEASFTNEYKVAGASLTVEKINENNQPLSGAKFRISTKTQDGTDWTRKTEFTIGEKGSYTLEGLDFDTLYRLEETAPPDNYAQLIESIYFKIRKDDGYFLLCKEDGTPLTSEEADAKRTKYLYTPYKTLKIINKKGYVLPKTGGTGTLPYIALGSALILGAACYTVCVSRRKKEVR